LERSNYTITSLDYNTTGEEWERYLRAIIQKPARLLNVTFDPVLVNQLLEDCKGINGVLPALQLALVELWKKGREKVKIESADYDSLANGKGIAGVIEAHANTIWGVLTRDGSDKGKGELMKSIFIRLVEITSNKEDVRKTVNKTALVNELNRQSNQKEVEEMLNALSGPEARLIRIKRINTDGDSNWVEVIHEVLIRQWDRLRNWLEERRAAIRYRNKLEEYIEDDNPVLTGKKLSTAEQWISNNTDLTTEKISTFITRSRKHVNQRKTTFFASFGILILLIVSAWIYYPIYDCRSCALVKNWEEGNYNIKDVHTLTLAGTRELKYLQCFKNLDTLVLQGKAGDDILSQEALNSLPKQLKQLSVDGFFTTDSILEFSGFQQLKGLSVSSFRGLQKVSIKKTDSLTELTLSRLENYKVLTGLETLKNLQSLTLSKLSLSNVSGVEQLSNLRTLALSTLNNLSTLTGLEKLENLHTLILSELNIPSLENIEKLKNLQRLTLSGLTKLFNISSIEKLENLQSLSLELHIDSLPGMKNLKNLRALSLTGLQLQNLSAINALEQLQELSLSNLNIPDLSGIEQLYGLQHLTLSRLNISNLAGIEKLNKLRHLTLITLNNLSTFAGLEQVENLHTLAVAELNLFSLDNIDNLKNLQHLNLSRLRSLSTLEGIENLVNLYDLTLSELNVPTIAPVGKLKNLHRLTLSYLPNIHFIDIANLESLQSLSLSYLPTAELQGIERLKNIRFIYLEDIGQNNPVSIPGLTNQNSIDTLAMYNINLNNLDFIDEKIKVNTVVYSEPPGSKIEKLFLSKANQMKHTQFLNKTELQQ
jgi:Leucine-rich repeat (LRR) protein